MTEVFVSVIGARQTQESQQDVPTERGFGKVIKVRDRRNLQDEAVISDRIVSPHDAFFMEAQDVHQIAHKGYKAIPSSPASP